MIQKPVFEFRGGYPKVLCIAHFAVALALSLPASVNLFGQLPTGEPAALAPNGRQVEFDAVSIKIHQAVGRGGGRGNMTSMTSDPQILRMRSMSTGEVVMFAYDVSPNQLRGAPPWLFQNSFDITATTSAPATRAQQKIMMQAVLRDRFNLLCRKESTDGPVFSLTQGNKVKLKEAKELTAQIPQFAPRLVVHNDTAETLYNASGATMEDLAAWLATQVERPVLDKTGLAGAFDISLSIAGPTLDPGGAPVRFDRDDSKEIITAVREQLGLRLEPQRHGQVEVLRIERISQPSEN
jgi:uncharacterized protein (TIGR03435 family)